MLMSDTKVSMLQRSTADITPQGYTYAIEPNTTHPFWKENGGESNYKYTELQTPVDFENTDTNYTTFDLVQDEPAFFAPLTLSLAEVVINTEVALPFVGILHGDVSFLICEGVERNKLRAVGVYSSSDMSTLRIEGIKSTPAPIKGENGEDGVTPDVTATASVSNTTGVPSVNVTRSGSTASPIFDFSFTNIKGEKGDKGENGSDGTNGTNGADGVTPRISVIATVDDTTGTPNVEVTKSGTDEAPIFDFEFTGLKGEKGTDGGSSVWTKIKGTSENIIDNIKALVSSGATEFIIRNANIDSFSQGFNFIIQYVDSSGLVQQANEQYDTITMNSDLDYLHFYKADDKWFCETPIYYRGNITLGDPSGNRLMLYNPLLVVTTITVTDSFFSMNARVVKSNAIYYNSGNYSGKALNVEYEGDFSIQTMYNGGNIYYK